MPETNPTPGVQPEATDVNARLMNYINQVEAQGDGSEEPAEAPQQAKPTEAEPSEPAQGQAEETGELTPEDVPEEAAPAQPEGDVFKIVHNGQELTLTRADVIKNAQQGFDYTKKTQALAEKERLLSDRLQKAEMIDQIAPILAQDLGQVKALEGQLAKYQSVDWVRLATDDPLEYPKHRAQYDLLVQAYQGAVGQYNQKRQAVDHGLTQIRAEQLAQEEKRLPDLIPEWKDEAKRETGKKELFNYLTGLGADPALIGKKMDDALTVAIAYKAFKYDQLLKGKAEKSKLLQTAPPVVRPGAVQTKGSEQSDKLTRLQDRLKKTGDQRDAVALLLERMR
jgi:ribosomal protein S9